MLNLYGIHHHCRVVFWELFLSSTHRSKIGQTWNQTANIWQGQYENETTKELISYDIIIIGTEIHKLYALQRLLH